MNLLFRNGVMSDLYEGRTKDEIVKAIKGKYGMSLIKLGCSKLDNFVDSSQFVVTYFGEKQNEMFEGYMQYM
jgi:hypothetical protein